jgi:hypothetical protein
MVERCAASLSLAGDLDPRQRSGIGARRRRAQAAMPGNASHG